MHRAKIVSSVVLAVLLLANVVILFANAIVPRFNSGTQPSSASSSDPLARICSAQSLKVISDRERLQLEVTILQYPPVGYEGEYGSANPVAKRVAPDKFVVNPKQVYPYTEVTANVLFSNAYCGYQADISENPYGSLWVPWLSPSQLAPPAGTPHTGADRLVVLRHGKPFTIPSRRECVSDTFPTVTQQSPNGVLGVTFNCDRMYTFSGKAANR